MAKRTKRDAPANTYKVGDVYYGRVQVAGKEHRWSLRTRDAAVAAERLKLAHAELVAAAYHNEVVITWEIAFTAWSEALDVKPSTAKRYADSLHMIEPHLKGADIRDVDRALVSQIVKSRRADGVTTATIRRDLSALSSVLEHAIDEDWIETNPARDRMKRLKERRDPIVLPDATSLAQVRARTKRPLGTIMDLAIETGCRQDELVSLERRQIDWQRGQLTLYKTKTSRPRVIDLTPAAIAALRATPAEIRSRWLFWPGRDTPPKEFASRFARITRSAQKSAENEGRSFRPFTFHDLRHLYAVTALKNGVSIYDVQQNLGHASIKTTEIYLAFLTPDEARVAKYGSA